jgi:hypothetical protein
MWLLKESRGMSDYPIQCVTYIQAGQNAIVSLCDLGKNMLSTIGCPNGPANHMGSNIGTVVYNNDKNRR